MLLGPDLSICSQYIFAGFDATNPTHNILNKNNSFTYEFHLSSEIKQNVCTSLLATPCLRSNTKEHVGILQWQV